MPDHAFFFIFAHRAECSQSQQQRSKLDSVIGASSTSPGQGRQRLSSYRSRDVGARAPVGIEVVDRALDLVLANAADLEAVAPD